MEGLSRFDELMGDGSDVISNKVFVADARRRIDLWSDKLLSLPQYRPPKSKFPGGVLKLGQAGTFLLFKSGKVVINGVQTEPDDLEFLLETDILLYDVKMSHCSGYMHTVHLDLALLQTKIPGSVYERDLHPGLIFRLDNVSVIAHYTGKILFCGCKSVDHAYNVRRVILNLINM